MAALLAEQNTAEPDDELLRFVPTGSTIGGSERFFKPIAKQ
jgi:hypothetical protein